MRIRLRTFEKEPPEYGERAEPNKVQMIEKRYQIWTNNGLEWCKWFCYSGSLEKWQLKGKQLNEYREVTEDGQIKPLPYSSGASSRNK